MHNTTIKKYYPEITSHFNQESSKHTLNNFISVWITSSSIGDTICVTPAIRKLKEMYSSLKIDVYTYYPEIFIYNKNINAVYKFNEKLECNGHYIRLRMYGYQKSFLTFYSSTYPSVINYFKINIIDFCSQIAINQILQDNEKWLEVPISENENISLKRKITKFNINFERAVVIHPSITWQTRTWPIKSWQTLTKILTDNNYQVISVGKSANLIEQKSRQQSVRMQPCPEGAINFTDKLSILETIALLHQCKAAITVDSGLLHMALCSNINIIGIFTVVHPMFRRAWRKDSYDYKFAVVPPTGDCFYCSYVSKYDRIKRFDRCFLGKNPQCLPPPERVYETFIHLLESQNRKREKTKGEVMQHERQINVDQICNQTINAKLNVYKEKESFESILKTYNEQVDNLIEIIGLMKLKILDLEAELEKEKIGKKDFTGEKATCEN